MGPWIPRIDVTDETAATPAIVVNPAEAQTNDHSLLSPGSPTGNTHDSPNSPAPSEYSATSTLPPPSPTNSELSHHFQTTLALRNHHPDEKPGFLSPQIAHAAPSSSSHHRNPSIGTINSENGEGDGETLTHISSVPSKAAASHEHDGKDKKNRRKRSQDSQVEEGKTTHEREELADQNIDPTPFDLRPYELAHMLDPKNLDTLRSIGGAAGLLRRLGTSAERGLSSNSLKKTVSRESQKEATRPESPSQRKDEVPMIMLTEPSGVVRQPSSGPTDSHPAHSATIDDRKRVFGENVLPERSSKSIFLLMWIALKDKVLILLSIAAVVSLALGLFQDFGTPREPGEPPVEWVEGVAIIIAIMIVVLVGSLNDWQKERQFKKLNEKKEERGVKVIRDGQEKVVDIKEVVVGDIALLEPGEIIPCDGVFLSGHNVRCDESGATGESDAIKKLSYEEVLQAMKDQELAHTDCFVLSGSKVLEGVGKYVVVAVGQKSFNGRIMMALRGDTESTPLQLKLNRLAELIAKVGSAAGLLLFTALMIRFFVQLGTNNPVRTASQKGLAFVDILIISVTLIVVAVPEGLPLAVTLALAFATKRMTSEKLLVRVLGSCETMANASVVCTDKTGTLTQNSMTVVAGSIGVHAKFVRQLDNNAGRSNAEGEEGNKPRRHVDDFSIDQSQLNTVMSTQLRDICNEAIAVNSTAFEDVNPETGEPVFVGSKTETALLQFAKDMGWRSFREVRDGAEIVQMIPFSSERKAMGVVVKLPTNAGYRLYVKGASEILTRKCTSHVVVHQDGNFGSEGGVETRPIDDLVLENIQNTIIFYANQTLRTMALCYRDFADWPPHNKQVNEQNEVEYDDISQDLVLIGITGIEDPLRDGVRESVTNCHRAGVTVKMCTGDNVLTARSIAAQCGIFTPGGIIIEGPVFRKLSESDRIAMVPRLQVLARSSPEDKKVLVETLKSIGEVVGVTGDGTNDGPALKTAHVGFSMGIAGTEVAKEASDIILMDDNFSSIVKAIMWGRCVNDAVRKFLQFQISTNVTAVVITFVTAVASTREEAVLSAVQLLWINIIMDTFAALALATDPASESLLDRKPDKKTAPLFSTDMYKMILFQSIYQIMIIFVFHFRGNEILGYDHSEHNELLIKTLVFNIFVFAQIFNSVNCRRLDRHLNIFEGILRNQFFIGITLLEIAIQVLIVFVGGAAFQVTHIPGREWGISIALGFVSIPIGVLVRLMPNGPFEKVFRALGLFGKEQSVLPSSKQDVEPWNGAIDLIRDNLGYFARVRGGRLRASSLLGRSRKSPLQNEEDVLPVQSMLAMVPTLIAGTVATGARWNDPSKMADPAHADPSRSSAALFNGQIQVHSDTPKDDPLYVKYGDRDDSPDKSRSSNQEDPKP